MVIAADDLITTNCFMGTAIEITLSKVRCRRIFLTGRYEPDGSQAVMDEGKALADMVRAGALTADELLARYCAVLYQLCGTYTVWDLYRCSETDRT